MKKGERFEYKSAAKHHNRNAEWSCIHGHRGSQCLGQNLCADEFCCLSVYGCVCVLCMCFILRRGD